MNTKSNPDRVSKVSDDPDQAAADAAWNDMKNYTFTADDDGAGSSFMGIAPVKASDEYEARKFESFDRMMRGNRGVG